MESRGLVLSWTVMIVFDSALHMSDNPYGLKIWEISAASQAVLTLVMKSTGEDPRKSNMSGPLDNFAILTY
jgi:hypothetical protein